MSVMPVLFKKFLLEALSIAVSAGVALSPPPAGLETEAMWVAGLLVWTLLNLILRFIPDFVVLMMMSCMWVVLHIMPFQQAFESFTGTTVWLLVGALGIGTAVTKSGLLTRVALCTMKLCSPTFSGQVFAMLASGVVLSPFIPSTTAKVAVAGALATDVGERLGLEDRSWGMSGIWCAMYTSYSLMSPILMSASYFSYVILNLMPEHIRGELTLVRWSVAMLPWGVVTFLGAFAAISILYKPKHKIEISREDINERPRPGHARRENHHRRRRRLHGLLGLRTPARHPFRRPGAHGHGAAHVLRRHQQGRLQHAHFMEPHSIRRLRDKHDARHKRGRNRQMDRRQLRLVARRSLA